ncbi:MAG TPA: recombinase family protein [Ktedonosporobacter sp.]|nr:recombinase family protein [Ktedonosporobacter sp.]
MSTDQADTLIYCRVSERTTLLDVNEDPQERWQKALMLQRRQCEEFAAQLGYKVADYIEEISDAVKLDREGLDDLYAYSESGAIKYVIVTDPSRLSFDRETCINIMNRLAGLGVEVVFASM